MGCDLVAGVKTIEVFLCILCLFYKLWTVWESLRVFYELEKQSREWPLSKRIAVDRTGSIFSDIVLGSYVLITAGLLIGHCKGELRKARTTEGFFLVLGTILFLIVGGVSIATVDDAPPKLMDNGIILGILTIATAVLFMLDLGLPRKDGKNNVSQRGYERGGSRDGSKKPSKLQQTQKDSTKKTDSSSSTFFRAEKVDEDEKDKGKKKSMFQELKSSIKRRNANNESVNERRPTERNVEFQEIQEVHGDERQNTSSEKQVGRRNMENRGFSSRQDIDDVDNASRKNNSPDEIERTFTKVRPKSPSNGYINNEGRQTASSSRDDERYYSNQPPEGYSRRDEYPESRRTEFEDSKYRMQSEHQPNGYVRRDDEYRQSNGYIRRDGEHREPNGYVKREIQDQRYFVADDDHPSRGHSKSGRESESLDYLKEKRRRHSIDYFDKDEKRSPVFSRHDDKSRSTKDWSRNRSTRSELDSPLSSRSERMQKDYDRESERYNRERERYERDREKYETQELRKPKYIEDRESYKGYSDTVKYLERSVSDKEDKDIMKRTPDDVDSAMPPKHVIEMQLDDHFYKPQPQSIAPKNIPRTPTRDKSDSTLQVSKVTSSQKAGDQNGSSDDSELIPQIPSVSFLLSERGRKIMPSLSSSPVERVATPKYYFADPSSPGYVKQAASNWPSQNPNSQKDIR